MARELNRGEIWRYRFCYVGHLGRDKMREVCRTLSIVTGCDTP